MSSLFPGLTIHCYLFFLHWQLFFVYWGMTDCYFFSQIFAEKNADVRRIESKIICMVSAWISGLFCENLREPFSLSNLKFLLMP
jgi:hypothetical protein